MSKSHQGAIRPKSARANSQTVLNADGTESRITWIRLATAEKRLRRYLAKSGCTLLKSRPGTKQHDALGEYAIFDEHGELVSDRINLAAWLKSYGLMADHERIAQPIDRGWMFYVARYEPVVVDGIECNYAKPITKEFTTEAAALKAVAHLTGEDREGLVICSFDASARIRATEMRKGGTKDA